MWKSKDYSVAYFECITAFKVPYITELSLRVGAHMCIHRCTRYLFIYGRHESPPLTDRLAIWRFECVQNIQRINFQFLHGTVIFITFGSWKHEVYIP